MVQAGVEEASIEAVVVRCGCGDPLRIHPDAACPTPRALENRGIVRREAGCDSTPRSASPAARPRIRCYHYDVDIDLAGKWWYRYNGTGALVAANETGFVASPTVFP